MKRRDFTGAAAGTAAYGFTTGAGQARARGGAGDDEAGTTGEGKFGRKYAPHPGLFRSHAGDNYLAQVRFAAEVGFTAWEDKGMLGRPREVQEQVAACLAACGMTMGVFTGYASYRSTGFADPKGEAHAGLARRLEDIVACARRVGATWVSIVPGVAAGRLSWDVQCANVVAALRGWAEVLEGEGRVMVLEPDAGKVGQGTGFLPDLRRAAEICRAVDSPACRVLAHFGGGAHGGRGNLANLDKAWPEVAYVQAGGIPNCEVPGAEPRGLDHRGVLRYLDRKGFQGVIGMEHGGSHGGRDGERALLRACRHSETL